MGYFDRHIARKNVINANSTGAFLSPVSHLTLESWIRSRQDSVG
jgi:hypothetical protein